PHPIIVRAPRTSARRIRAPATRLGSPGRDASMAKSVLRISLLAALVALTAPSVRRADAQSASGDAVATPALEGAPSTVTLITGDRVALSWMADGRPVVAVQPANGLQPLSGYQTLTFDSH